MPKIKWPGGKKFAFSIFDDTDHATVEKVGPVYQFLEDLNFHTTKSVWPIKGSEKPRIGGDTCENPKYLKWLLHLQENGFEIGLHNVTYHTSIRADTIRGLERFRELFGNYPKTMANHAGCYEGIYWGDRLTGFARIIYYLANGFRDYQAYRGHIPGDKLFWGDLCFDRIKYVRNFVFSDLNTLKACPQMPYHDSMRPYVQYWFASTEGQNVKAFINSCNGIAINRLEEEGGACIMYTHFASGFFTDGKLDSGFRKSMEMLSEKNGWYIPVGELLDYICNTRGTHEVSTLERKALEWHWLFHKLKVGHS